MPASSLPTLLETGTTGEMGPKARVCAGRGGAASWGLGAHGERPERQRDREVLENVGAFRPPACRRHPELAGQPDASITDGPSRADRPRGRAVRALLGPWEQPLLRLATARLSEPPNRETGPPRLGAQSREVRFSFFFLLSRNQKNLCAPLWAPHRQRRVQAPPGCG